MAQPQPRMTNNAGINLAVAVWLAYDDYDYNPDPRVVSVTTLIKPPRQTILKRRIPVERQVVDIADRIGSRMGQALHSDVEHVWKNHYVTSLQKLGYPNGAIRAVRINPEVAEPDTIPVYTEVRTEKEVMGFIVTGKVDLIIEARLHDVKKTSVWGYQTQKSVGSSWKLQGSIYRWLNPDKIQHDELFIQYLLLDWSRALAKRDPNYPPHAVPHRVIPLMSVSETDKWVRDRLRLLEQLKDAPEDQLPECTEEDLWRSDPVHKYYANEDAPPGTRSTKNFDDLASALMHKAEKGKGRVDTVPGRVKACLFCDAFQLCTQKDRLIASGELVIE